jgi:hypothetical protein
MSGFVGFTSYGGTADNGLLLSNSTFLNFYLLKVVDNGRGEDAQEDGEDPDDGHHPPNGGDVKYPFFIYNKSGSDIAKKSIKASLLNVL